MISRCFSVRNCLKEKHNEQLDRTDKILDIYDLLKLKIRSDIQTVPNISKSEQSDVSGSHGLTRLPSIVEFSSDSL